MSLDELMEIVQKSKFQDLLDAHNFKLVYMKAENQNQFQESFSIGFESSSCKLGFHCEATIGVAMIAKSSDWEQAQWIDLEYVIAYLLNRPISQINTVIDHLDKYMPYQEKLIYALSKIAEDFEPLFDRIAAMFEDEKKIAQWKQALEVYVKEDTQRRYCMQ